MQIIGINRSQPDSGIDDDGEEGNQHRQNDLWQDAEAEPDNKHRREGNLRHSLGAHDKRIEAVLERARGHHEHGERNPDEHGAGETEHDGEHGRRRLGE